MDRFEKIKKEVYEANMLLPKYNLVTFTWGNVSAIDRKQGIVAIKPSGLSYENMLAKDIVIIDLSGNIINGEYKPSSDTATHLELYRNFKNIGGIVHTHSTWATTFAQAGEPIKPLGTTHADYFSDEIPVTRKLTTKEIDNEYELETGRVIVERFNELNPDDIPGVLVNSHGPFTWGKNANNAVHNAVVLEEVAKMAFNSTLLKSGNLDRMQTELLNKHYFRKHGESAYYGQ